MKKQKFVLLGELLLQDNEKVKKLKSLYKREGEYEDILGPVEYTIATYYLENRKLKDKDVVRALKNIKMNYLKGIEHFNKPLEKELMLAVSESLQDFKITHHEFILALNYILWCIDNRKWLQYNRAYLNWILDFFGMASKKEKERFNKRAEAIGKEMGISKDRLAAIKGGYEAYEETEEDERFCMENSKYFTMSDEEKCDYFLKCKDKFTSMEVLKDLLDQIDCYMSSNKFNEAIRIIDKIKDAKIERQLREMLYSMKIESFVCLKQYDDAEKIIQELIAINKDYPMPYFNRALIHFNKKEFEKALEVINETIRIAERVGMKHPQYYLIKARILKELNDPVYKEFEKLSEQIAKENIKMVKKMGKEMGVDVEELMRG